MRVVASAAKEVSFVSQSLIRVERSERPFSRKAFAVTQPEGRKEWINRKEEEELNEAVRGNKRSVRVTHSHTHSITHPLSSFS